MFDSNYVTPYGICNARTIVYIYTQENLNNGGGGLFFLLFKSQGGGGCIMYIFIACHYYTGMRLGFVNNSGKFYVAIHSNPIQHHRF